MRLIMHIVEMEQFVLVTNVVIVGSVRWSIRLDSLLHFVDKFLLLGRWGVVHRSHPPMPFWRNMRGIEVVKVGWLYPTVLAEGIVDLILVVSEVGGKVGVRTESHVSQTY